MTLKSQEFHAAMFDVYRRAKTEAGYNASRFLQMLEDNGGLETARLLLHAGTVSDGYVALWERKRIDLTVEALILHPRWLGLFSDDELEVARKRLREYGFDVDAWEACHTADA